MADYNGIHNFTNADVVNSYDYIHLRDVKASGTDGGTATAGAWETRVLNTKPTDTGSYCVLSSNQFTLAIGTYEIEARSPCRQVDRFRTRLRNITDGTTVLESSSEFSANAGAYCSTTAFINGRFNITAEKVFELQQFVGTTQADSGMGRASSLGTVEIYAEVILRKVG